MLKRKYIILYCVNVIFLLCFLSACSKNDAPYSSIKHTKNGSLQADIADKSNDVILVNNPHSFFLWKKNHASAEQELQTYPTLKKIKEIAISANGAYAITADYNAVTLWGLNSGKAYSTVTLPSNVVDISIAENGQKALIGLDNQRVKLLDLSTGVTLKTLKHEHNIVAVVISTDGSHALTSNDNQTAQLWDLHTGHLNHVWLQDANISAIALSNNNKYAMTTSNNGIVKIWHIKTGKLSAQFEISPMEITNAALSPKGRYAAIAAHPQILQLWDLKTNQLIKTWQLPKAKFWNTKTAHVHDIAFNPNESVLISEDSNGYCHLWVIPKSNE